MLGKVNRCIGWVAHKQSFNFSLLLLGEGQGMMALTVKQAEPGFFA